MSSLADIAAVPGDSSRNQAKLFWMACFLGGCALITVTASSIYIVQLFPFLLALQIALIFWSPYLLATPFVLWVARRFPLNRISWRRNIWVHTLAAFVFVGICDSSFAGLLRISQPQVTAFLAERHKRGEDITGLPPNPLGALRGPPGNAEPPFPRPPLRLIVFKMQFSLPLYWVLVGVAHAVSAMAALRAREVQAAQLAAHLTQAQLAGLRTQLQPHFLFNTLNSIAALIPRNAHLATEMVMNLSDLLRMTLREPQRGEIRLSEELTLLRHYVDIQRLRFGEKLAFHVQVSDAAANFPVPPLLLQPLVENAIRHGLEASDQTEHVTVYGQIEGDALLLEVTNTFSASLEDSVPPSRSTGLGLANTRARLKVLFGENCRFEAGQLATGGFRVTMRIPAHSTATQSLALTHEDQNPAGG